MIRIVSSALSGIGVTVFASPLAFGLRLIVQSLKLHGQFFSFSRPLAAPVITDSIAAAQRGSLPGEHRVVLRIERGLAAVPNGALEAESRWQRHRRALDFCGGLGPRLCHFD